jgi:hypothetical protein
MSTKADYTDEEWAVLCRAPLTAGFAVSYADPGGPIEFAKETMAALRAARTPPSDQPLLVAVANDGLKYAKEHRAIEEPDLKATTARQRVVDELTRTNEILSAKATPEEAKSFRAWLIQAAQDAANAAKEGGFLGIGATLVSEREEAMLDQLREILGVQPD